MKKGFYLKFVHILYRSLFVDFQTNTHICHLKHNLDPIFKDFVVQMFLFHSEKFTETIINFFEGFMMG